MCVDLALERHDGGMLTKSIVRLIPEPGAKQFRTKQTAALLGGGCFLGPRGPHGIPLSVSPSARKIWITYIQAYMPHESSEDSSNQPDGPMGSPKCSP